MTAVVKAESLTKRFGEVSAVTHLSFALEAGTITGFLGPNGAGKTTTLRMILGLVAPTSGRALVFDHPYAALPRAALRIGAVLEATDFHPGRSGRDHLRMLGQAVDVPDSRADEVLRLVELGDAAHRRVRGYSLGMRQRLGLAIDHDAHLQLPPGSSRGSHRLIRPRFGTALALLAIDFYSARDVVGHGDRSWCLTRASTPFELRTPPCDGVATDGQVG
jgi:ABC-type cobalamin transport system ATPase subunit